MLEEKSVFPSSDAVEESLAYVGGGDGSMVLDHEIVFVRLKPVSLKVYPDRSPSLMAT
jgi:hypothetical protein